MPEMIDVLNAQGEYTGEVATRKEAHEKGLWHKAVVLIILNEDGSKILLQKRANNPEKPWPNMWDVSVGGHVNAGEFGYQAVVREAKEELGLEFEPRDLLFIGATISSVAFNHMNEYYVVRREVDVDSLKLQEEEVQEAKWFGIDELKEKLRTYDDITGKSGCWEYVLRYLKMQGGK